MNNSKNSQDSFLRTVHSYYPSFIKSGSSEYGDSKEFIKLEKLIKEAKKDIPTVVRLKEFLSKYTKIYENMSLQDYTLFESYDRCYNIQLVRDLYNKGKSHSLCINISLLSPTYTIHILEIQRSEDFKKRLSNPIRNILLEKQEYNQVISEIRHFLTSKLRLKEFPSKFLFEVIPNIGFQNADIGNFNFYNAFFLDEFYTR